MLQIKKKKTPLYFLAKESPHFVSYLILALWALFIFFAVGWVFAASLSTTREIFSGNLLQSGFQFNNYVKAIAGSYWGLIRALF